MVQQGMVALLRGASRRWGGSSSSQRGALLPSMYSLSRAFSSKLFVGGLSYHTNEEMLRTAFAEHGEVTDVRIITDRETGRSRGFGFITFSSESDAEAAKAKMSNHLLDGRFIRVDLASNRPPQSPATPRPFGNSSGFSFGTPGTRPPVVEDWGPLPSYSTNTTQSSSTAYQGGFNSTINTGATDNGMTAPNTASSSSSAFQQVSSSTSSTSYLQSSTSASEVRSSSFESSTLSSAASVTTQQSTVSNSGIVLPDVPSPASSPGIAANDFAGANATIGEVAAGQSFVSQGLSEVGQASTQTASFKQDFNVNYASQSGVKLDSESTTGMHGSSSTSPSGSSSSQDFRSFADHNSNAYKYHKPQGELQHPKKHVVLPRSKLAPVKSEIWESRLTEEAVPPPKGPLFDFGLGAIPDSPPPLGAGANPQGGFNLSVCLDDLPEAEPVRLPYSIFTARTLPPLDLPWLTPEADNWSEIGKPPRRIEDSPYSPFSPDLKDDPEFWWDPYDFDPEAKLLKEAFAEEPAEADKVSKEPEAEEAPAANVVA